MKKRIYVEAGNCIISVREKRHFTIDYVSVIAKVFTRFLYKTENGLKAFSADNLYRIYRTFDVSSE